MKTFLAVYIGSPAGMDAWKNMKEDERKQKETAGMQAWQAWAQANAAASGRPRRVTMFDMKVLSVG